MLSLSLSLGPLSLIYSFRVEIPFFLTNPLKAKQRKKVKHKGNTRFQQQKKKQGEERKRKNKETLKETKNILYYREKKADIEHGK